MPPRSAVHALLTLSVAAHAGTSSPSVSAQTDGVKKEIALDK
jgi:hypothetical protein